MRYRSARAARAKQKHASRAAPAISCAGSSPEAPHVGVVADPAAIAQHHRVDRSERLRSLGQSVQQRDDLLFVREGDVQAVKAEILGIATNGGRVRRRPAPCGQRRAGDRCRRYPGRGLPPRAWPACATAECRDRRARPDTRFASGARLPIVDPASWRLLLPNEPPGCHPPAFLLASAAHCTVWLIRQPLCTTQLICY